VLGLPFASIDVSQVTASGYVRRRFERRAVPSDSSRIGDGSESGKGRRGFFWTRSIKFPRRVTNHPPQSGVQYEALRLLDGGEVSFPSTGLNKWGGSGGQMNTSALLVVASGAFSWLRDEWDGSKAGIGFAGESGGSVERRPRTFGDKGRDGGRVAESIQCNCSDEPADRRGHRDNPAEQVWARTWPRDTGAFLEAETRSLSVDEDARAGIGAWSVEQESDGSRTESGTGADPARAAVLGSANKWL